MRYGSPEDFVTTTCLNPGAHSHKPTLWVPLPFIPHVPPPCTAAAAAPLGHSGHVTGWAVDSSLAADLTVMGRSVAYHMGVQQYKVEVPRSACPAARGNADA